MLRENGLNVVTRSSSSQVTGDTQVFLGDTIGEMGLYYRLSEICCVGRSLGGTGGQNPLEPALLGTATLSGTNVQNFRDAYKALLEGGGAKLAADEAMLAEQVKFLLEHPTQRKEMAEAGRTTVQSMRGALEKTMANLDSYIRPLRLKAAIEHSGDLPSQRGEAEEPKA